MLDLNPIVLGLILLVIGSALCLLVLGLLRQVPKIERRSRKLQTTVVMPQIANHNEAILLVQHGGRVVYLNQLAEQLFHIQNGKPNLESLARRTHPSEVFLALCAGEGQARFSLNGQLVEGKSYFTPGNSQDGIALPATILVSLKQINLAIEGFSSLTKPPSDSGSYVHPSAEPESTRETMVTLAEIGHAMTGSSDLYETLQRILENIELVIPADILEITLWDAETRQLQPYHLVGSPGEGRRIKKFPQCYQEGQGYSGYLVATNKPLLVQNVNAFREVQPALDRQRYPFASYLGVPMRLAGELIGTIEVASFTPNRYDQNHLKVLQLLTGQAAIALKSALIHQEGQQQAFELAGLAHLAQTISSIHDSQDLFSQLLDCIAPLVKAKIIGFLVYDESRRTLQGQVPFLGIPSNVVEWYRVPVQANSVAEKILQEGEVILATNAPENPQLIALDLQHLALAAGIKNTVLVPLRSGGRTFGYLQAADKLDSTPFNQDDLRLLSIVAGQIAPIIENTTLVQQSRHRAQRSETLRRIASLISSSATLDETLKFSLLDLARLLQADVAFVSLLDESRGELQIHNESVFGILPEIRDSIKNLSIGDPQYQFTITGCKKALISQDLSLTDEIPPIYKSLFERLEINSVIGFPLIAREHSTGEFIVGSQYPHFFSEGDIQTIATASGQLATAIEQSILVSQTDQTLRKRVDQLTALTRISHELNTTLLLEHLLQRVYDEALYTTRANCGTILLFETPDVSENKQPLGEMTSAITTKVSPENPKISLYLGDAPDPALHVLERAALKEGETVVIDDFNTFASDASEQRILPSHSGIRSALIVPITSPGQVSGLIHLHARDANHFGDSEVEICKALAIQAAIAIGNAQRYQEQVLRTELLNQRVETLSRILQLSQVLQSEQPLEQSLEAIAYAIQSATPFNIVLISVYEPRSGLLHRTSNAGLPIQAMEELVANPQPWERIQSLLQPEFQTGRVYFIPVEHSSVLPDDLHSVVTLPIEDSMTSENSWHPEDTLIVPLYSSANDPLGLISVDAPRNKLRPDRPTIETLEIFSNQAAFVIESHQKMDYLKAQVDKIDAELSRTREIAEKAQRELPTLKERDLMQSKRIQELQQRSNRINACLEIVSTINRKTTREDILLTLGREAQNRLNFDLVLLAKPTPGGVTLMNTLGNVPEEVNIEALLGQRNPLRYCMQTGETLLVPHLEKHETWKNTLLLRSLKAQSFICLPIALPKGEQLWAEEQVRPESGVQAALLGINRDPMMPFNVDDEQSFNLLGLQVAAALHNVIIADETAQRYSEISLLMEFSKKLGSLNLSDILNALVETAAEVVPSAQMIMVSLWDDQRGGLVPQAALGYADSESLMKMLYHPNEGLPGQVFVLKQPQQLDVVDFAKHYNLSPENMSNYRKAIKGHFPVSSLAIPIIAGGFKEEGKKETERREEIARARPIGVITLDSVQSTSAFTNNDLTLITSLAQQTALTLENIRLYQASERRSIQLQSLTNAATAITSSLQIEELVATLLDQLQAILPYDTGTLWLRQTDVSGRVGQSGTDIMVIRAARGFDDSHERIGLTVDIQDSRLLHEMITTGRPIWVPNILNDLRFRPTTLEETSGKTAAADWGYERLSWLGVPLISSGEVIGVIALEKVEPNYYSSDDIEVASAFASQAAIGLENARLFQESVQRAQELAEQSQTLTTLNRLSSELSGSLNTDQILESAVKEFLEILPCTSISVLLFRRQTPTSSDDESVSGKNNGLGQLILQYEFPTTNLDEQVQYRIGSMLSLTPLLERLLETQGIFNSENVNQEPELNQLGDFLARHSTRALLIVPIVSGGTSEKETTSEPIYHGFLFAHNRNPYRYGIDELELARTISNQLAISLQNARLYGETRSLSEELELRVQQRTAELAREHKRSETLLRINTELSASLDLEQVLHSTLQVLSECVDAEQIAILIARPGEDKLYRLVSIGYPPESVEKEKSLLLDSDQGLAGWIINQRQSILIDDLLEDRRWLTPPDRKRNPPRHHVQRSALGVPLMSGAEALGCLLLLHPEVHHFTKDHLDLVQAAANQVAVAVNNAELYRLIRDQAEDLGNMLRSQQIENSRSKAILEAVADGVLVTNTARQITLFNNAAEKILGLNRSQLLGKSMTYLSGLFGHAAQKWMETIDRWSQNPTSYDAESVYSDQITLEDQRVIMVHLAPVIMRNDFLGTVSIFQDITHQVEVDRLKSEFVATVSHELRTPMTSIKGYIEILLMGAAGSLNDQQTQFLQIVKANTERLTVLVNDLLDISQIESGRMVLSLQPVNLDEIANLALAEVARHTREDSQSISIQKEIQPNLPPVLGDPERIRAILGNLLDNAYQYNLPNGKITLRIHQTDQEVRVDVQDTGVGIPPEDQPRVFERFFRGQNPLVLGVPGTGLGLSIVQRLVEMHNGRIWVESKGISGEGSTFSFTLPIYNPKSR